MTESSSLFGKLTKLFRSGPTVRRAIKSEMPRSASSAVDVFKKAHSNVYNATISAYGSFDRMCLDLDTKIAVPSKEKFLTLKELMQMYPDGQRFVVYAYDHETKSIVPAWAHHPRSSGVRKTVKVNFDDGSYLVCTPDHPCMLRDGNFKDAGELEPGQSMMPFYRKTFNGKNASKDFAGYHSIYSMSENSWRGWQSEHKMIAEWFSNRKIVKNEEHVHHLDFNPSNNDHGNLLIMDAKEHLAFHAKLASEMSDDTKKKLSEKQKLAWAHDDGTRKNNLVEFNKSEKIKEKRRIFATENNVSKADTAKRKISAAAIKRYENIEFRNFASLNAKKMHEQGKLKATDNFVNYWKNKNRSEEWKNSRTGDNNENCIQLDKSELALAIIELKERKKVAEFLQVSPSTVARRAKEIFGVASWAQIQQKATEELSNNHKVVSVEPWIEIETGDLTVDGYENFATDTIVVHNSRYSDFSEMEATAEICSALDIYAEETVSPDEQGNVLHIYSDNRKVHELLHNLFYDVLNVEFNLVMWVRNLCKYGDFFLFNDIHPEYGVINAFPISISEIEREEGFDPNDPAAVRFRWITQGNQLLENWQVTHFRMLGNDAFLPYGSSVLEGARRIWRQLILIEDAMLVYRVIRAPERRVFYIDVGNVPPDEVANYLEQVQTSLKRNQIVDKKTGKVDLRYNPLSVEEDFFLPVRGGESGTKIDTLAGGQNTAAIEDVQYIQKKLFAALKIPKAYLGYDEDIGCLTGDTQISLLDGRTLTMEQLVEEYEAGKQNWVYSFDTDGNPQAGKINNAWLTKKVDSLYQITLDNGQVIRCTPNHPFMLSNGNYLRADELKGGESLMTLHKEQSGNNQKSFKTINIEIINFNEMINVYDLEIEHWHNFALDVGVVVHNSKATLSQEDIRFSRSIQRIQKTVVSELNKLAQIHLYCHGFEGGDLADFKLHLSNPSTVAQMQKLELIRAKFEIAGQAPDGSVNRAWIQKNVLGLTDADIEEIHAGRIRDKKKDLEIESITGEPVEESGGDLGGGGGGSLFGDMGGGAEPAEPEPAEETGGKEPPAERNRRNGSILTALPARNDDGKHSYSNEDIDEDSEIDLSRLSIMDSNAPLKADAAIRLVSRSANFEENKVFSNDSVFPNTKRKRVRKNHGGRWRNRVSMPDHASMTMPKDRDSVTNDPYGKTTAPAKLMDSASHSPPKLTFDLVKTLGRMSSMLGKSAVRNRLLTESEGEGDPDGEA